MDAPQPDHYALLEFRLKAETDRARAQRVALNLSIDQRRLQDRLVVEQVLGKERDFEFADVDAGAQIDHRIARIDVARIRGAGSRYHVAAEGLPRVLVIGPQESLDRTRHAPAVIRDHRG